MLLKSVNTESKFMRFVKYAALSCCLTLTAPSHAEDIEIYSNVFDAGGTIGTSPETLNPNILFILDNSGSMNDLVLQAVGGDSYSYDSTQDYGNSPDDNLYIYSSSLEYTGSHVTNTQNQCQAQRDWIAANPDNPLFYDKVVQWERYFRNGDWRYRWTGDLQTQPDSSRIIECQDDRGVHSTTYSTVSIAGNCRGGCSSSTPNYRDYSNREPYGNGTNNVYLVPANFHDYMESLADQGVTFGGSATDCVDEGDILQDTNGTRYECARKMTIMKAALNNALDSFNDVNVGLMNFNSNGYATSDGSYAGPSNGRDGGTIVRAVQNINTPTVRQALKDEVAAMSPGGWTPLAETMYEGYRYFAGATRLYGETRDHDAAHAPGNSPVRYKSPIVNECQDNNIVLLSDGLPTFDQDADSAISNLMTSGSCRFDDPSTYSDDQNGITDASCLDDLAGYMANTDMSSTVRGDNPVYTYTIGFNIDTPVLGDAADAGRPPGAAPGSGYFRANDILQLENAFRTIVGQIQEVDADTFVAPAVTVNAFNRLQNREDIYYVVFKPNSNARWNGNLKKYKVTSDAKIVDANNNDAISESTGFFKDEAQSFWSDEADGPNVIEGGMAEKRGRNRDLYGSLGANNTVTLLTANTPSDSVARFIDQVVDTAGIDIGEIGSGDDRDDNIENIAAWTIGTDVDNDGGAGDDAPNYFVGDNIHSQPYVLSYGTSDTDPRDIIFFTSNQGLLHAVTGADRGGVPGGTEAWAYVPDADLFENFGNYYNRSTDKVYGLDSEMSFSVTRNPTTNAVTKAHLFFGQRRGGNKLFAVDVTNAVSTGTPVAKLWTIEGGSGDFDRLGQTWSEPVVSKINYCQGTTCGLKDVIIFSGGYDDAYDDPAVNAAARSGNVLGNAIYIVDAANGDLLWMAGSTVEDSNRDLVIPQMTHSIPSKPTALDVTKDGATDILFFTDITGQVFRIDFKASPTGDNSISSSNNAGRVAGGMIADLSQSGADRRFFNPVDVTLLPRDTSGAPARYALVTGSGYRAKPLEAETYGNRLYVIYDQNIFEPLYDEDLDPSLDGDADKEPVYLYARNAVGQAAVIDMDVSQGDLGEVNSSTPLDINGAHKYGFYANVTETAEKLITPTLISDFRAIAVSYVPADRSNPSGTGANSGTCSAGVGTSNAYEFNLLTGELEKTELVKPGLTAEPVVIYVLETDPDTGEESLKPIVIIGTEPFEGEDFDLTNLKLGKAEKRAWWERGRSN